MGRFLKHEKAKKDELEAAGGEQEGEKGKEKEKEVQLRPITMADFVKAKEEVSPSVSEDAFSIAEVLL